MKARHLLSLATLGLAAWAFRAEATAPAGHPLLLIGFDGGEWSVIEDLWTRGELPNLQRLANEGVRAPLETEYGWSPVIWTTVATGHVPDVHGITGFVVATDDGDVPVSSEMRKVPAIWNITSAADMRTNLVGWWGSWPPESVNGVNISERCQSDVPDCATPLDWNASVEGSIGALNTAHMQLWPGKANFAPEDRVTTEWAPRLAKDFDFMAMYVHGTDPNSHKYWQYFRPGDFDSEPDPERLAKHQDKIPRAYRSFDTVVGRVLESAGDDVNVIIVSDHGFHALDDVTVKVTFDLDKLLVHLGYATYTDGTIDVGQSQMWTYGSALNEARKRVRISMEGRDPGGTHTDETAAALRAELEARLATITYTGGEPAFTIEDASPRDQQRGGDFVISTNEVGVSKALLIDGEKAKGIIAGWVENSGGHSGDPAGVFIAHGPDIDPAADMSGIRIHDVTPTLLYGLGLPVGEDMEGEPFTKLFSAKFQADNPLQTVNTYGERTSSTATSTAEDAAMIRQLRQLGYME